MAKSLPPLSTLVTQCTRFLAGDGPRTADSLLAQIATDTKMDVYGVGGVVTECEDS